VQLVINALIRSVISNEVRGEIFFNMQLGFVIQQKISLSHSAHAHQLYRNDNFFSFEKPLNNILENPFTNSLIR